MSGARKSLRDSVNELREVVKGMENLLVNQPQEGGDQDGARAGSPNFQPEQEDLGPDLRFVYNDCDTHYNEIAELYTYTENGEFEMNFHAFEERMCFYQLRPHWETTTLFDMKYIVQHLKDELMSEDGRVRMTAARCILYLLQGCWAEVRSIPEQQRWSLQNVILLYRLGVFTSFIRILDAEIYLARETMAHGFNAMLPLSIADSHDLRIVLSALYTFTEVFRTLKDLPNNEYHHDTKMFWHEFGKKHNGELLVMKLYRMVTYYCCGMAPHFPIRKVMLLLWKTHLVMLGSSETLGLMKEIKWNRIGLGVFGEDNVAVAKGMRASTSPIRDKFKPAPKNLVKNKTKAVLLKRAEKHESFRVTEPRLLAALSKARERAAAAIGITDPPSRPPAVPDPAPPPELPISPPVNRRSRPIVRTSASYEFVASDGSTGPKLASHRWKPKIRQKDVDTYLKSARKKYLERDERTDAPPLKELPLPVYENVVMFEKNLFTTMGELQMDIEDDLQDDPSMRGYVDDVEFTPAEMLYQGLLPDLPQHVQNLVFLLVAATPYSQHCNDRVNILSDVLPEPFDMYGRHTFIDAIRLDIDVRRHCEVLVKAILGIILLLLKHFKLNHVYQFEYLAQHLVFSNCIPIILKFFDQHMMDYVSIFNQVPMLDFPRCVRIDLPIDIMDSLGVEYPGAVIWRNMFSTVNALRILLKLAKWKDSRVMMLYIFHSVDVLVPISKMRHPLVQLYSLKLIKIQSRYLGREWRMHNMTIITAIYQKVRLSLVDNWMYGVDMEVSAWDIIGMECNLRTNLDHFNKRRYFVEMDNETISMLEASHELSNCFREHFMLWQGAQEIPPGHLVDWIDLLLPSRQ